MDRPIGTKEKYGATHGGGRAPNKSSDSRSPKVNRSSSIHCTPDRGYHQLYSGNALATAVEPLSRRPRGNSLSDPRGASTAQQTFSEGRVRHSTTSSASPAQLPSVEHSAAQVSNSSALISNTRQLPLVSVHRQTADHVSSQRLDRIAPSPVQHRATYHKPLLASYEERVPPPSSTPLAEPKGLPAVSRSYREGSTAYQPGGPPRGGLGPLAGRHTAVSLSGVEPQPAPLHGQPLRPPSDARYHSGTTDAPSASLHVHTQPATIPGPPVVDPPRGPQSSIPSSPRERRRSASISSLEQRMNDNSLSSSSSRTPALSGASSLAPFSPNSQVAGSSATTKPASSTLDDQRASGKEKTTMLALDTSAVRCIAACGLKNLGNTCYMNAVIQVMRHIRELNGPLLRFCAAVKLKSDSILKSYGDLVREMQEPGVQGPVSLRPFKTLFDRKCPRFSGYDQQDATEFMRLLINEMHEEWKALSVPLPPPGDLSQRTLAPRPDLKTADTAWLQLLSAEKTDIAECFMGMYKSTIKCLTCSNEAVKFEPFWDLSVPFPQQMDLSTVVQLETCLDLFTKEETLDKDEKPYCEKCSTKRTSVKQLTLQKQPTVIVIVLKRFAHTRFGTIRKIETTVSVPFTLDMNKYTSNTGTKYTLFAMVNHVGTDRFGHYTAWCKSNLEWNVFNDSIVKKTPPPLETCVKTKDAYALFYRPVATDVI